MYDDQQYQFDKYPREMTKDLMRLWADLVQLLQCCSAAEPTTEDLWVALLYVAYQLTCLPHGGAEWCMRETTWLRASFTNADATKAAVEDVLRIMQTFIEERSMRAAIIAKSTSTLEARRRDLFVSRKEKTLDSQREKGFSAS